MMIEHPYRNRIEVNIMDNQEFGADILTLVDEEGNEHEFEVADTMEMGDQQYMALIPVLPPDQALEDAGELLVLKVVEENGEEFLEPIDNEEEFSRIADAFMVRLEDTFDFVDDDAN